MFSPRKSAAAGQHPNARDHTAPAAATLPPPSVESAARTRGGGGGAAEQARDDGDREGRNKSRSGRRKSARCVFSAKRFYLDLRTTKTSSGRIRQLVEDIQLLGGTIEDFFSREVSVVISDAPEWKLRPPSSDGGGQAAAGGGAPPDSVSPGTPRSLAAAANSSWSPATSLDEKDKRAARSRVDTILERARQQSKGTSDVIDNAHKWGLKVWSLQKIVCWLETFKRTLDSLKRKSAPGAGHGVAASRAIGVHTRSQSVGNLAAAGSGGDKGPALEPPRCLVQPFLKFEDSECAARPVHCEFRHFPALNFEGQAGTSPFYRPDTVKGGRGANNSKGKDANGVAVAPSGRGRSAAKRLLKGDENGGKQHHRDAKRKATRANQETGKEPVADQSKDHSKHQPKQHSGYCEICEKHFNDLEEHIASPSHTSTINQDAYWEHLDIAIGWVNKKGEQD